MSYLFSTLKAGLKVGYFITNKFEFKFKQNLFYDNYYYIKNDNHKMFIISIRIRLKMGNSNLAKDVELVFRLPIGFGWRCIFQKINPVKI